MTFVCAGLVTQALLIHLSEEVEMDKKYGFSPVIIA